MDPRAHAEVEGRRRASVLHSNGSQVTEEDLPQGFEDREGVARVWKPEDEGLEVKEWCLSIDPVERERDGEVFLDRESVLIFLESVLIGEVERESLDLREG